MGGGPPLARGVAAALQASPYQGEHPQFYMHPGGWQHQAFHPGPAPSPVGYAAYAPGYSVGPPSPPEASAHLRRPFFASSAAAPARQAPAAQAAALSRKAAPPDAGA